jgi:hypothetical protein
MPIIPILRKWKQRDHEFEASLKLPRQFKANLSYIVDCLKTQKMTKGKKIHIQVSGGLELTLEEFLPLENEKSQKDKINPRMRRTSGLS